MLTATWVFPQIRFSQSPSLFGSRESKQRKCSKTGKSRRSSRVFTSISHRKSVLSAQFRDFGEDPDEDTQCAHPSLDSGLVGSWLQSCSTLNEVKRVHAVALRCLSKSITYVDNNLISTYLRINHLIDARKVFDEMPKRNVVTWSAIINGYLRFGLDDEALGLLKAAIESGVRSNHKMFVCMLSLCSRTSDLELGRQVHACILKGGWRNLISDSALVHFYTQCEEISSAFHVFDQMQKRDVVCWTTMISAYSQQGREEEAFSMFSRMLADGFSPNEFTVCSVLKACGEEKALRFGKQLHGAIVKKIYKKDVYIGTSLVDMYAKCGEMEDSTKVFNGMRSRNTVTWTSIIAGYAQKGLPEEAIDLFREMRTRRIYVNDLTLVTILRACGSTGGLRLGKEVHARLVKSFAQTNMYVGTTLVWFYCKCREDSIAFRVLQEMPLRDVVSWTAMISGCADVGREFEALGFLRDMLEEGVEPNSFTYSSALKACTKMGDFVQGKLIHSSMSKTLGPLSNVFVGSALIHMYDKCGWVSEAYRVFESMEERNLVSWQAMILCYARNGFCLEGLILMYKMEEEGYEVDDYTLTALLNACGGAEWDVESFSEYCLQPG